jgi:hypothetical protein
MTSTPYLYVNALKRHLILRGIACSQHIGAGRYQVRVRDAWVAMDAGENRINTGGAPVRGMELYADESTAEALIVLETALRISGGPFQMEIPEKGIFDVFVKRLWSTLHLLGDFPHDPETHEFPFRITLPDGHGILWYALDSTRLGKRSLAISELSADDEIALIRAVAGPAPVVVERVPLSEAL